MTTTTLAERVLLAMSKDKLLTQAGLARACGISRASVNGWVKGATDSIDGKYLTSAAMYLSVSPHWLSTGEDLMQALPPDIAITGNRTRDAMMAFQQEKDEGLVHGSIQQLVAAHYDADQQMIRATGIVYSGQQDIPILTTQTTSQWRNYLTGALKAERTHRYNGENIGTTFAYEVDGDMMQPDFPDGALAIIETDITPQHGDVILIQDGTVNYLRKLVIDGQDKMIITLDDRYPAKFLRGEVIGVVSQAASFRGSTAGTGCEFTVPGHRR